MPAPTARPYPRMAASGRATCRPESVRQSRRRFVAAVNRGFCTGTGGFDGPDQRDARDHGSPDRHARKRRSPSAEDDAAALLGPRPLYLVDDMDEGSSDSAAPVRKPAVRKDRLLDRPPRRGPAVPRAHRESYRGGARMGAGIIECDVTFTKDRELVCRHSQCDLHTTTNILAVPELAAKCTQPFTPADPAARHAGVGHVLHERHHARRVQDARGQDGRVRTRTRPRSRST